MSSTLAYFLTVRVLLLPIVCHCVSQSLLLRSTHPSSLSQLSIISKLSPHRPVPCSLYPPINGHCTNHRIADPQTKIQTYSTTKNKQTNKQYTTNIIIIIIPVLHVTVTSTPRLMIPTVTSYKPLPLHNAYSKTYIISLHPIHIVH